MAKGLKALREKISNLEDAAVNAMHDYLDSVIDLPVNVIQETIGTTESAFNGDPDRYYTGNMYNTADSTFTYNDSLSSVTLKYGWFNRPGGYDYIAVQEFGGKASEMSVKKYNGKYVSGMGALERATEAILSTRRGLQIFLRRNVKNVMK